MLTIKTEYSFIEAVETLQYIRDYFMIPEGKNPNPNLVASNEIAYATRLGAPRCSFADEYSFFIGAFNSNPLVKIGNTTKSFQLAPDDLTAKWEVRLNSQHPNYSKLKNEVTIK